ncbi:hypothetical protein Droror1_Dr00024278, partial [Drosera rotundifolia]
VFIQVSPPTPHPHSPHSPLSTPPPSPPPLPNHTHSALIPTLRLRPPPPLLNHLIASAP